jgi:hypothetical protein
MGEGQETGYDAIWWLILLDMDGGIDLSTVEMHVHSANPVGAENMRNLWDRYQRYKEDP